MSLVSSAFWKKKNVLITGIHGFIGSHLAVALEKKGARVWGFSRTMEEKNIIKANIIDYSRVDEVIKEKKIDICFHLAAESLVESGEEDPYQTFKINTLGTLNILECARKNNLERVIIASTVQVYGDSPLPFKEDYPAHPSRPYETSKTCIDLIAQSYAETFDFPVLISRLCNIYGPGDLHFNRLIPKTIKALLQNTSPEMWGGEALREYMYIDDAVSGYIKLAEMPIEKVGKNRIFNFGTGEKFKAKDVIELLIKLSKKDIKIKKIKQGRKFEIKSQYVSSAKARKLLQWKHKVKFEKGIKKTITWYRNNLNSTIS